MKIVPQAASQRAAFDARFELRWSLPATTFTCEAFLATLNALVNYPERTSSTILRAEIIDDQLAARPCSPCVSLEHMRTDWELQKTVLRQLLPRNPKIDQPMHQYCFFFSPLSDSSDEALVCYEPVEKTAIPFYHPQVAAIAFHYASGSVSISFLPLPGNDYHDNLIQQDSSSTWNHSNRVDRTLLHLLSVIAKHSEGYMNNYQKRVHHDQIIGKAEWQDLYVALKSKYATEYVDKWVEDTDPRKHVFEDLGIASFVINLWHSGNVDKSGDRPTFVDVGCGNGLLVNVLCREGWKGYGFDARHRKSWSIYDVNVQANLKEMILFPRSLCSDLSTDQNVMVESGSVPLHFGSFDSDSFLIGNHADELTPYIPLLAALSSRNKLLPDEKSEWITTAGFMIIPCCMHTFSGAKHNSLSAVGGRYSSYISWLVKICGAVGWVVEKEALRIPSTRNWALVGRRRRLVENQESDHVPSADPSQHLLRICQQIVQKNGGMGTFLARALGLAGGKPPSH